MNRRDQVSNRLHWHAVTLYVELSLAVPTLLLTAQLSLYHVWLAYHGISTYDHIVYKRELDLKTAEFKVSLKYLNL